MQASKIMPHQIYAIHDKESRLVRFRVTAVVTRRVNTHNNPHDFTSSVEGYVIAEDGGGRDELRTIEPTRILGPYEAQVELAERERAEKAAEEAKKKAIEERAERLTQKFYAMTGLERPPQDERKYYRGGPFRAGYQGDVEMTVEGVAALLEALESVDAFAA